MPSPLPPTSRILGSLYGVAIADALGGPVEFRPRGSFPWVSSFRYNPNFDLAPGTWTDDTSMTFCLAQSLVETRAAFSTQDQVRKYIDWFENGYMSATGKCFDIGNATRVSLGIWGDWIRGKGKEGITSDEEMEEGQALVDRSLKRKVQCGSGSLMRVSPVALIYHSDPPLALTHAAASSRPTHPYLTCVEACQLYTHLLLSCFSPSVSKSSLCATVSTFPLTDPDLRSRVSKYGSDVASYAAVPEADVKSSGYVIDTLEAALWAFFTTDGFREGAEKAVNLGDDADTVGAVYGGLAGAFYGVEGLPEEWMEGLEGRHLLDPVVDGVVKLVQGGRE